MAEIDGQWLIGLEHTLSLDLTVVCSWLRDVGYHSKSEKVESTKPFEIVLQGRRGKEGKSKVNKDFGTAFTRKKNLCSSFEQGLLGQTPYLM